MLGSRKHNVPTLQAGGECLRTITRVRPQKRSLKKWHPFQGDHKGRPYNGMGARAFIVGATLVVALVSKKSIWKES